MVHFFVRNIYNALHDLPGSVVFNPFGELIKGAPAPPSLWYIQSLGIPITFASIIYLPSSVNSPDERPEFLPLVI